MAHYIVPLPFKELVGLNKNLNVQVARGPAIGAQFTLTPELQTHTCVHSRGYLDLNISKVFYPSNAFACRAGVGDYFPSSVAMRTGGTNAKKTLRSCDLTAPTTDPADLS